MKNVITLVNLLIVLSLSSWAQEKLIVPKGQIQAFKKQTRNWNGQPGENYWQNTSDYKLKTSIDFEKKVLNGSGSIVYYNNSPDSLNMIVIRLYQDLFKEGANRNSIVDVNPLDIHDGVDIKSLTVNNIELISSNSIIRKGTLMYIKLNNKLAPKTSLKIETEWSFPFPQHTLIRMGSIDSTSLFVGQWYPQVAVYDDVYGWDKRSYNGMAEFYNDFSNFEVEITVPKNFIVWATGEPTNMEKVLQKPYYKKYLKATTSDEIVHLVTEEDLKKGQITTDQTTWKYKALKVSDFAFGISDHYLWDITSVEVDQKSKRRTVVDVAYNQNSKHFDKVIDISRATVKSLSEDMPGIPYPFDYLSVYNGDFGMEYPMITNVGADNDYGMTVYANSHEIAHAYFPFYVGTNETKNGWMDEGLIVFIPEKIQNELEPTLDIAKYNTKVYSAYSGLEDEPALITPTHYLDSRIYFYLNYAKTEQALRMLEMELGKDLFKTCLTSFIEQWKYKHPTPIDFFNTFNEVSGKDLNWFWNTWYYQSGGTPDLAISKVTKDNETYNITIENKGNLAIPIVISFYNNDQLVESITKSAKTWTKEQVTNISLYIKKPVTSIKLSTPVIPDANRKDNEYILK